jgi:hypothetical protein
VIQKRKLLLTGLIGITIAVGVYAGQAAIVSRADGAVQPGSADDPLVTKSYLDEQLKKVTGGQWTGTPTTGTGQTSTGQGVSEERVKELLATEIAKAKQELLAQIPSTGGGQTQPQQPAAPSTGAPSTLEVIQLEAGQTLYGGVGTELIVRSGKTIAVSNSDGIPDVTAGKDIVSGAAVENNHLLIIPREGRGIKPDPKQKGDIYVMVRGIYILLKEDGTTATP